MARRINKKVAVLSLAGVGLIVLIAAAAAYYAMAKGDPRDHEQRGDELVKNGDYVAADIEYARAQGRDADNPVILLKRADAILKTDGKNAYHASQRRALVLGLWSRARELDWPDPQVTAQATELLLDHYYRMARLFPTINHYNALFEQTDLIFDADADNQLARKYRGIAQVARMRIIELSREEREAALADLTASLAVEPDDVELTYRLAQWHLIESRLEERDGRDTVAADHQDQARRLIDDYVQAHSESVDAQMAQLRYLLELEGLLGQKKREALSLTIDRLETLLLTIDMPDEAVEVAGFLPFIDREPAENAPQGITRGLERSEALLRSVIARHPDHLRAIGQLAMNLYHQDRIDEAVGWFQRSVQPRLVPVTIDAIRMELTQKRGFVELANIYMQRHAEAADPDLRAKWLEMARQSVVGLREHVGQTDAYADRLEGKLAIAHGDFKLAVEKLKLANAGFGGRDVETLRLTGLSLERLGELGAARQHMEQVIALDARNVRVDDLLALANLAQRTGDPDRAHDYVDRVLAVQPDLEKALLLKAMLLAADLAQPIGPSPAEADAKLAEAVAILEAIPDTEPSAGQIRLAALYETAGRIDQARAILDELYAQYPGQIRLLQKLVQYDLKLNDKPRAIARLNAADQQFPDNAGISVLQRQLAGETNTTEALEQMILDHDDPLERALSLAALYDQTGRRDEAEQKISDAAAMQPDDERVLLAQLNLAIAKGDFEQAMRSAERARSLNLDQAEGMFWFGRVELAQQRYTQAIATFNRGLNMRPHHSEGWRMLGDAHRANADMENARKAYERALELKPNSVPVLQRLFMVADTMGMREEALDALARAHQFAPDDRLARDVYLDYLARYGDVQLALTRRLALVELDPEDQSNRMAVAILLLGQERLDEARVVIEGLLAEPDGRNLQNVSVMAAYHRAAGQFEQGRAMLQQYVEERGDAVSSDDWVALARFMRGAGQHGAAEQAYRQAIRIETDPYLPATRELGDWLFNEADYTASIEMYQRITHDPSGKADRVAWSRYIEALIYAGQLDMAREELNRLTSDHGQDVQSTLFEGLIAWRQGEDEAAGLAFERAVIMAPDNPHARFFRARLQIDHPDDAVQLRVKEDLLQAIRLDPKMTQAHDHLVQWYLHPRRADVSSAMEQLQQWVQVDPDSIVPRARLIDQMLQRPYPEYRQIEALLDESAERFPGSPVWHDLRARTLMQQDRRADAVAEWAKAYRNGPAPDTLARLVAGLLDADEADEALRLLDERPEWLDQQVVLLALRGRALSASGQQDQAIETFTRAFAVSEGKGAELSLIAAAMRRHLSADQIFGMLEKQVATDPAGPSALVLASTYAGAGRADEAQAVLSQLIEHADDSSELKVTALRMLGSMQDQRRQYTDARRTYEALLALRAEDTFALNNLAYLLSERMNQLDEALPLAQRAVASMGNLSAEDVVTRASALDTLGHIQYLMDDLDRADVSLRQSIRLAPTAAGHLHLGQVMMRRGQPDAALGQFEIARQIAENRQDAATVQTAEEWIARAREGVAVQ